MEGFFSSLVLWISKVDCSYVFDAKENFSFRNTNPLTT